MHNAPKLPFQIKLCGFTRLSDVEAAIDCGADAIGLNFYPASKRFIDFDRAEEITRKVRGKIHLVGVFVNPSAEYLRQAISQCLLDSIQLHGKESPQLVKDQNFGNLIKALPWRQETPEDVVEAAKWSASANDSQLIGFLIDAFDPRQWGGTGTTTQWNLLYPRPFPLADVPLILAGGLHADNVSQAIQISRPNAVDTASGIESSPGIKDVKKMQSFVQAARSALKSIHS